jgi:hypothetical protein
VSYVTSNTHAATQQRRFGRTRNQTIPEADGKGEDRINYGGEQSRIRPKMGYGELGIGWEKQKGPEPIAKSLQ